MSITGILAAAMGGLTFVFICDAAGWTWWVMLMVALHGMAGVLFGALR